MRRRRIVCCACVGMALFLGACSDDAEPAGEGQGGAGQGGNEQGSGGTPGSGGDQGCASCASIANDETGMVTPDDLCASSRVLFDTMMECICANACPTECGSNVCMGTAPDEACGLCLDDTPNLLQHCGDSSTACLSDS